MPPPLKRFLKRKPIVMLVSYDEKLQANVKNDVEYVLKEGRYWDINDPFGRPEDCCYS